MTKEQTNSWGSVEEILKYYDITNPDVELQLLRHFFDVKAKLISQEKEKMVKQIEKDIIKIIEEWASTPDEESKMKTYVADYFNLLQK